MPKQIPFSLMKDELIKEKEKFGALFEHAGMGIILADDKGIIKLVNQFLLGQFGYKQKSDLQGKPVEILIPKKYKPNHQGYREKYMEKPSPRVMGHGRDLFGIRKDGSEFSVEVSLSNFTAAEESFVIAFVIDITQRKVIEDDLINQKELLQASYIKIKELNDSLENEVELRTAQLQKALNQIRDSRDELSRALNKEKDLGDLKSRFVAMASHEFRTPLSTILSSASLLAKYTNTEEQDKRDKHIERIKKSVHNLTGILSDFLSMGKIDNGKIELRASKINIPEFILNICHEMEVQGKENQKIKYKHIGEVYIFLDESLLTNIIFNLISNAQKFSADNGEIKINTTIQEHILKLEVKDSGIGISKKDMEHLTERFFRAENATNIQGTGLGLHIVSKYVEIMNGSLKIKSNLGKGTTLTLQFKSCEK